MSVNSAGFDFVFTLVRGCFGGGGAGNAAFGFGSVLDAATFDPVCGAVGTRGPNETGFPAVGNFAGGSSPIGLSRVCCALACAVLPWLLPLVLRHVVSVVAFEHPVLSAVLLSPSVPLLLWLQVLLSSVLVPPLAARFLIPGSSGSAAIHFSDCPLIDCVGSGVVALVLSFDLADPPAHATLQPARGMLFVLLQIAAGA